LALVVPEPALLEEVDFVSDPLVVPYSNLYVVEEPFGFTEPFRIAPWLATPEAASVVTDGFSVGGGGSEFAFVVKVTSPPGVVPLEFVA